MEVSKLGDLIEVFEGITDWRRAQQTRHVLSETLTVAVCAVLSGADDFEEISQWGQGSGQTRLAAQFHALDSWGGLARYL